MAAAETTTATATASASASASASVGADVAVMTTTTTTGTSTAAAVAAAAAAAAEAANGREARNLAEKQRRDKLNASIQELATMVPHAAESTRRLDKTAVLRFATHGLRLQYVFGKSALRRRRKLGLKGSTSPHETNPLLTDTLMQLLDSFFITLTCNGQIVLVSPSVEKLLGHCQSDLYGQNLLQITHPDDQALLRQQLIPRDIETLFYQQQQQQQHQQKHTMASTSTSGSDDDDNVDEEMEEGDQQHVNQLESSGVHPPSPRTIAHLAAIDERLRSDRRCFSVRLSRASTRAESTRHYELVKIDGCFRRSDSSLTGGAAANYPIVSQLIRRSRNNNMLAAAAAAAAAAASATPTAATTIPPCLPQHDAIAQAALHGISGNDIVLVAMARIIREDPEVDETSVAAASPLYTPPSLLYRQPEPYQLEYQTRHLIDGSIIDCDQRIGIVAGYMKDEVRNLSPFCFMHLDDVRWVIVALRQMYDCNSDYGESCYRLLSRNGRFIYLQTKGFLEIDKSTNKVHSFLCVNTLLDEQAGKRKVQEMKNKFSTIIKADIPTHTSPDLPASKAPQQLERIVLYLIENLQKSAAGQQQQQQQQHQQQQSSVESMEIMDDGYCSPASTATTLTLEELSSPSPPQLALVPPAPSSVKHSITQSVSVVNTAARNLQYNQQESIQLTPVASPSSNLCPSPQEVGPDTPPSPSPSPSSAPERRPSVLKKSPPNQLHAALKGTLRCLDNKLFTQNEEVQSLYQQQQEQRSTLHPKLEQQMDAIMLEHQKQKQLLVNIQSEYDAQPLPHTHPHPVKPQAVSVITTAATTNSSTTNCSSNRNTNGTTSQQMKQQRRVL